MQWTMTAYFAKAVSYMCKMFMKLTTDQERGPAQPTPQNC
jgi:hypothetical protein